MGVLTADPAETGLMFRPFEETERGLLLRRAFPPIANTLERLSSLRSSLAAVEILDEYAPGKLPERLTLGEMLERNLAEEALNTLSEIIPIDVDQIWVRMDDFYSDETMKEEFRLPLIIYPQGVNLDEEEFWEGLNDPDNYFADMPEGSIVVFCLCLTNGVGEEMFMHVAEYCHWPVASAAEGMAEPKALFKALKKRGLVAWEWAFRMAWFDTGSRFFDWGPLECYKNAIPMTVENVRELAREWEESQKIVEAYREIQAMTRADPFVMEQVIEAWNEAAASDRRPRTLVELWGGMMEEEEEDNMVDPFYGPLDGRDNEQELVV